MSDFNLRNRSLHTVEGLGSFIYQCVGNTSHTTGCDHFFLREGADKPHRGAVRFKARVTTEGSIAWDIASAPEAFPPAVIEVMRQRMETLKDREPSSWMFHALGAAEIQLKALNAERSQDDISIHVLTPLLANPTEPKQHWVSAVEGGQPKGFHRPATAEERKAKRAVWAKSLKAARQSIAAFEDKNASYVDMLKRQVSALRNWASLPHAERTHPCEVFAAAAAAPEKVTLAA